ncbi:DUF1641 domain-containing protein [Sulfurisphaera ohwakuensis]|uniref:DUF1641 domain-containing protein n=1 Tax=Sulfurisphaera ohwakuensis TaxID=69656 RepID=A0A650CKI8_SULOH|nr:DUF1641 domain-containing protein [Sulfurisphaera ohwakuensis]MBB5253698.1 uncharacterized protein YjgD (DUF1641 family) [Sulfurisphaera ohwakuensis]QGR18319.1 DUF1641 domain-containing protein [Sulfurisphaera ohwakuensis]
MEEGRIQTIDGLIEELIKNQEAINNFLRLLKGLQKSGILPFLVGVIENIDQNLEFMVEENNNLIRNLNLIYAILNGKEETGEIHMADIIRMLNDPDVRKGIYLVLKILKAIGSASKEG